MFIYFSREYLRNYFSKYFFLFCRKTYIEDNNVLLGLCSFRYKIPTTLEISNFKYICIQKNVEKARGLAYSLIRDIEGLFDFIIEFFEIEEIIKIRGDEELINNIGSTFNDKMNETFLGMITDIKYKNDNEETIIHYYIIFIKCENTTKSDKDNYFEGTYSFKDFLKEYLTEEKLINSERIIERKEMEKIFIDILTEKDASYIPEF